MRAPHVPCIRHHNAESAGVVLLVSTSLLPPCIDVVSRVYVASAFVVSITVFAPAGSGAEWQPLAPHRN